MDDLTIETDRLTLRPLPAEAIAALIAGDGARLEALTDARFPRPPVPPPLMEDALPFMLERVEAAPDAASWFAPWLLRRREDGAALGMAGFGGPPDPDADGAVLLGYGVYPAHEGRGYASEAAAALTGWALGRDGVRAVRATVPTAHGASRRVAERAGMVAVGLAHDEEVGEVVVFERTRSTGGAGATGT